METSAKYALIGSFFILGVIAVLAVIYWLSAGEVRRTTYKIIFRGSVSGLSKGGLVLFNGVQKGEVAKIDLLPDDPSQVYALVAVDSTVPLHTDTKARLEYTGLTGVAYVALTGGASKTPLLPTTATEPGVIYAEPSEYQNLVETAHRIAIQASEFFTKASRLIDDNSASITATMKNAEKLSDALAANSDGLQDFAAAATAIKKAADDLDSQLKGVAAKINRFAGSGLRQYEALAVDGRKTLEQINQAVRSIENNPQQFLFGKSPQIPEYSGAR